MVIPSMHTMGHGAWADPLSIYLSLLSAFGRTRPDMWEPDCMASRRAPAGHLVLLAAAKPNIYVQTSPCCQAGPQPWL